MDKNEVYLCMTSGRGTSNQIKECRNKLKDEKNIQMRAKGKNEGGKYEKVEAAKRKLYNINKSRKFLGSYSCQELVIFGLKILF